MADQQATGISEPVSERGSSELSDQIASSLASVWANYAGARPAGAEIVVEGRVVRWSLAGGVAAFEAGADVVDAEAAVANADEASTPAQRLKEFKRDTANAVARTTRRKVVAVMSKHDQKTGAVRETFILETQPRKY